MLSHTFAFLGGVVFTFSAFTIAVIAAAIQAGKKYDDINDAPCFSCFAHTCVCGK